MRPPTARPRKNEGELVLHTKPRGVVHSGQICFCGLASPRGGEAALLIPTRRSRTTRRGRSGRPVGPLQVNPSAWSLTREGPATGSPNRSWGRVRSLGSFLGSDCSLDKEEEGVE